MLTLDAVTFNHDPSGKSQQSAFNIRKDATTLIELPEWVEGRPSQSPAAYTTANAATRNIFVVATISRTSPTVQSARVRASERFVRDKGLGASLHGPTPTGMPPALEWNPVGSLQETEVVFDHGDTAECKLSIDGGRLANAGVGIGLVEWVWKYWDESQGTWIKFAKTSHRVYCTLSDPTKPWALTPFDLANTRMPWTDVLDYACRWAFRATSAPTAATACTRAIYGLGMDALSFDGGIQSFTEVGDNVPFFDCAKFLEALQSTHASRFNCKDAATVLSTFVNILGGDFCQVRFAAPGNGDRITLNPILLLGHRYSWPEGETFDFHETAIEAKSLVPHVFDACLMFEDKSRLLEEATSLETLAYLLKLVASNGVPVKDIRRFRRPLLAPQNEHLRAQLTPLSDSIPGTLVSAHWIEQRDDFRAALARWETPDGFGLVLDLIATDDPLLQKYVQAFPADMPSLAWRFPAVPLGGEGFESPVANCVVFRRDHLAVFARRTFQTGPPVLPLVSQFASALDNVFL